MALLALLLFAAPAAAKASERLLAGVGDFDLARSTAAAGCDARPSGEIVVCGRSKSDEIVVRDSGRFERKPLKAEVRLHSGATIDLHGEQRAIPGGGSAPAAMVRVRIPF